MCQLKFRVAQLVVSISSGGQMGSEALKVASVFGRKPFHVDSAQSLLGNDDNNESSKITGLQRRKTVIFCGAKTPTFAN